MIRIIGDLKSDWNYLDERIEKLTDEIEALARAAEGCQQLITVPGDRAAIILGLDNP